jgi:hypothetical protein
MAKMKGKIFFGIVLLLVINVNCLFAQGCLPSGPDGGDDPGDCPLDTWVLVLVGVALAFAMFNLYRRQKVQNLA